MTETSHPPSATPEAHALWQRTLSDLRLQMVRAAYDRWLDRSQPLAWEPASNTWTIGLRNSYAVDFVGHRLARMIRAALAHHTPTRPEPQITFAVDAPAPPPLPSGEGRGEGPSPPLPQPEGRGVGTMPAYPWPRAWTDCYIKIMLAFRCEALRRLKGSSLSVWMDLALHANNEAISSPGLETIMRETGLARAAVCRALDRLCSPELRLVQKLPPRRGTQRYRLLGYATIGRRPARIPFEEKTA